MNTVFVLMLEYRYEGCVLLGVYSSEDEAKSALANYKTTMGYTGSEEYFIQTKTINAPALYEFTEKYL